MAKLDVRDILIELIASHKMDDELDVRVIDKVVGNKCYKEITITYTILTVVDNTSYEDAE